MPPGPAKDGPFAIVAVRLGATCVTSHAPATPIAIPTTPPITPRTTVSPMICPTTRRVRHPIALSVPISRVRRPTAANVSNVASTIAVASAAIDNHEPSVFARFAALDRDPVTCFARSAEVVTVASGSAFWIARLAAAIVFELVAFTYTVLI